jgi:hypothetical protein
VRRGEVRFKLCVSPPENLDGLSSAQLRELVVMLLEKVTALEQLVVDQRAEIARLKGLKGAPDIKPSGMDKATEPPKPDRQGNRPRRGKIRPRVSIEDRVLTAAAPAGSRFKGYETYLVQDLVLSVRAIRYRRERWVTPDGRTIVATLPEGTCGHFGPDLRRFVLRPELTKRPDSTIKQTDQERYAALRTTSGGARSALKPPGFSDALCWTSQT